MKVRLSKMFCLSAFVPDPAHTAGMVSPVSYVIGGIIALLLLGYLIYTLVRPEKF